MIRGAFAESKAYLSVEVEGEKYPALLDSGCDLTIVPLIMAEGKVVEESRKRLFGVAGQSPGSGENVDIDESG